MSAEARLKGIFQIFDSNQDDGVSEEEAAAILKKVVTLMFALAYDTVGIYGALLGNKALWTAAIDTAMTQFVPQIPEQFRPELPLAKEWVAAKLNEVKAMGDGEGGEASGDED